MRSWPSVVTFQVDPKSNMAALASDWLTHFGLLLKKGWRDLLQTCHTCSLWGPDQVLLIFKSIRNPAWPPWPLIGWHILNFFSKNDWRDLLQTCHKCSLCGPDKVLLLFKQIRNPICPPWPLIGWHILNFFSRRAEGIYTKLATHVPYEVPTKCCYF